MQRALEEYRLAFELEPSNEIMSYNLGCCLYENGHNIEAIKYFKIFLDLLDTRYTFNYDEKELYKT